MKGFLVLSACLILSSVSQALTVVNVYDGKVVECPKRNNSDSISMLRAMTVFAQNNELVVQASDCINGKWEINRHIGENEYIAFDTGEKVNERYYDFVIHLSNPDISVYKNIAVQNFEKKSIYKIPLEVVKSIDKDVIEINVTASRDTITSGGFTMTDEVRWGSLRVFLNK